MLLSHPGGRADARRPLREAGLGGRLCVPIQISALPRAAGGWGLPGRVERGSVCSHTPCVCRERSQHGWTGCLVSVICHSAWPPLPLCPEGTAYSLRQLIGFSGKPSPKSSRVTQNSTPPWHGGCCQALRCHKVLVTFRLGASSGARFFHLQGQSRFLGPRLGKL